jgi:indolepyruvate ferredoxin oxidoreductase
VPDIAAVLIGHGVRQVIVTTDDVDRYRGIEMPRDGAGTVPVWNRTRIVEAQETLAAVPGVTVLIHDQACAAQNRRRRKRDIVPTPTQRVVINHRICEACGDCGEVSNCLSVQSIDTPLGVKTTIDQTTCNLDFSCLGGDCPSFMTVESAADGADEVRPEPPSDLPEAVLLVDPSHIDVRIAGIGGTGVVIAAQILATAAMLDGYNSRGMDQTGLSQKAGPVVSDLRLATRQIPESNLLGEGTADVLLAFDLVTAASRRTLLACGAERTVVVGSTSPTPTGSMIGRQDRRIPPLDELRAQLDRRTDAGATRLMDAAGFTKSLLGNASSANIFIIGAAIQHGVLPLTPASVEQAIRLNGVQVDANIAALRWGRAWISDPEAVEVAAEGCPGAVPTIEVDPLPSTLAHRVHRLNLGVKLTSTMTMLTADLTAYQDPGYAARFLDRVEQVQRQDPRLTETVARSLHKLMAYKDEYEIARLLLADDSRSAAERVGGREATITWRLHPPLLKAIGRDSTIGVSEKVGRPLTTGLAKAKRLRGTSLDPFGRTEMRRTERALIDEYHAQIDAELAFLGESPGEIENVLDALALPMQIRGYEDLKLRRIGEYRAAVAARRAAIDP